MPNLFLAPRSNETAHTHFESTIIDGLPYSVVESFLTEEERSVLGGREKVNVWGTKESVRRRWEKMRIGDFVLFYAKGVFRYSGRIVLTKHSEELGKTLWPLDEDGQPWPCLFFVENLKETNIPINTLRELAEYKARWTRVQGFMSLNDQGVAAIEEKFGSVEAFLNQSPDVYQIIDKIYEVEKEETIEGEEGKVVDLEDVRRAAEAYVSHGLHHKLDSSPRNKRIESRAQKERIAFLEGHACQICNWSLKWTDSNGGKRYRIDVDHIVEKKRNGGEEITNLWVLCPNCHAKKSLGVIKIDIARKTVWENGVEIELHHDNHLGFK